MPHECDHYGLELEPVFDLLPSAILVLRTDGAIAYSNSAAQKVVGCEELRARSFPDLMHEEDQDSFFLAFKESAAFPGEAHEIEFRLANSPGNRFLWMCWTADPVRGLCYASLRDVTSERRAERQLRRATNGLAEAERTASIGSWEFDLASREVHWSPEAKRLLGLTGPCSPVGEETLRLFDHDSRGVIEEALDRCMKEGRPYDLVLGMRRAEGRKFWARCIGRAEREGDHYAILHGVIQDVTSQREQELELNRARAAAEEASQTRSRFLSSMSHEIRTPLNGVIGLANLLLLSEPREDQRDDLEAMTAAAKHLLSLLNDILDLSKLEAGRIEIESMDFRLSAVAEGLKASLAAKAREKGIRFLVEVDSQLPPIVRGDPTRLLQVLTNLAGNAIKFTDEGRVRVAIERPQLAENGSDLVRFTVEDTGLGMSPEQLSKAFDEFSQASAATNRTHGGTGLGLPISRGLVDRMGGALEAESEPSLGSRFSFTLKLEPGDVSVLSAGSSHEDRPLQGARVLVAEDNSLNVKVVVRFLERWGMEVKVAEDGVFAISALESEDFDVALLDLHMPRKGGLEVAQWIRASTRESLRTLPLIALTAATTTEERAAAESVGMNAFVPKPFSPSDLEAALSRALALRVRRAGRREREAA